MTPHQDYLPLPLPARTSSSRIRWWQPLPSDPSLGRPVWALDNVFVGGTEINPSEVQLSFNDSLQQDDATLYEFSPYGQIGENSCSQENGVLSWKEGKGVRSFTTNQLIVQPGYMLQFKVCVGHCVTNTTTSTDTYLAVCVCLSIYLSLCLPTYLPTYLPADLSICLSVCLSIYLCVCVCVCLSIYLPTISYLILSNLI